MRILLLLAFLLIAAPVYAEDSASPPDLATIRQKAEQGDAGAQFEIGTMYEHKAQLGSGVQATQDYAEALKWFRKSAAQGNTKSQSNVGSYYYAGIAVNQDYQEAKKWFLLAAEQGDVLGLNNLGSLYEEGLGVEQSWEQAYIWYSLALKWNELTIKPFFPEQSTKIASEISPGINDARKRLNSEQLERANSFIKNWKPPQLHEQKQLKP